MINEAFGRRFFADQNPVGRRFGWGGAATAGDIEIVGVLGDARFRNDLEDIKPAVFMPMLQRTDQFALDCELEIRTAGEASAAAGELRRAVADVDPNLSVNDPKTLGEQVAANFDSQRLAARLVGSFGALALVLACVGLYGVIAQGVVRRTNEIGVRMALGARQGEVVWMILRDTLVLLAVGVAVGIPAAFGAARLVASQLYGVSAGAPGAFAFAAAVLAAVATVTGMLPAHRASRVDPMVALRAE
jgi:ABC-type antimicrobial peptide transport system permease subunit